MLLVIVAAYLLIGLVFAGLCLREEVRRSEILHRMGPEPVEIILIGGLLAIFWLPFVLAYKLKS